MCDVGGRHKVPRCAEPSKVVGDGPSLESNAPRSAMGDETRSVEESCACQEHNSDESGKYGEVAKRVR